jgi:AraC family transcriptional regulator, regulatory protein of adaptative response / DNA-3-methyladenine glycosylase II
MRRAYGFTPERLRKEIPVLQACKPITLSTDYRPPFNWTALLQFLHGRATPQEWVFEDAYHRLMNGYEIIVTNIPSKNCLSLQIPADLSRQSHTVLGKARALFDLDANPLVIEAALSRDLFLRQLIARHSVLRVPGCWDNFELLLRVILGQQVSVAGATTTIRRLVDRVSWPYQALDHGQLNTCACACCIVLMLFLLAISACKKQLCRVSAKLNGS